jgi:BirA family biotin operon repressor/biotin-[acetyl-CoA-carboxylase] ligase
MVADMAENKSLFDGALVITQNQTKGKGQRGNIWLSEPGKNLTFSLYLKPKFLKAKQQFELNRITALAIYNVLETFLSPSVVRIKWPNDLYVNKLKIGGILIENSLSYSNISQTIIGVGLNVNQLDHLMPTAISLRKLVHKDIELDLILSLLLEKIEHYYLILRGNDFRLIHQLYEEKLYKKDQVGYYQDITGKFNGILRGTEADGVLKIEDESGEIRKYQFKEVQFL